MKKSILYIILFLATAQLQAQGVRFGYDTHGNRISRRPIGIDPESKAQAMQNAALAPLLQDMPEELSDSDIKVFPNPAQAQFQVIVPVALASETMHLYDSNGREVRSQSAAIPTVEISDLPAGAYLLRVGKQALWRVVKY